MGEERGTYVEEERCIQGFGGANLMERPHGRCRGRWDDNIQMYLPEIIWRSGLD
jgi:hypothetical protein